MSLISLDQSSVDRQTDASQTALTMDGNPIYVSQPFLPPLSEFTPFLEQIWKSKFVTNGGPFHEELEHRLCAYLGVEHISLFTNGTIALVTALQALRVTGEVITTPYSFVATSHSLLWNRITPVFVDIDPATLNIDCAKIESAITPETTAIMPVHCYGRPCDVGAIREIAERHNLHVIYDAAHAFGVGSSSGSVLRHGDLSVLSFHATKVFNTFEGGAIVSRDRETKKRIDQLKNFGYVDEVTVVEPGINGKMSEVNAAFGILQLNYIDRAIARRKEIDAAYRAGLATIPGIRAVELDHSFTSNYGYFPVMVGRDYPLTRDELYTRLREVGIFARRYFYPLISDFPMYRDLPSAATENLPNATEAASRVLCLPIYTDLELSTVEQVMGAIAAHAA